MTSWGHVGGDHREMQVHHRGIAPRQDQADGLALLGTDGAEDVGRGGALVGRRRRTTAAPGPAAGDLVLLANSGLVGASSAGPAKRLVAIPGCPDLLASS